MVKRRDGSLAKRLTANMYRPAARWELRAVQKVGFNRRMRKLTARFRPRYAPFSTKIYPPPPLTRLCGQLDARTDFQ